MFASHSQEEFENPPKLGGGPLGYGDPDDTKLRKVEKNILIPKLIREEAGKRCGQTLRKFLDCSKEAGLLSVFKCREANENNNQCVLSFAKNPEFVKEMTEKYLEGRRHFRLTGEPLEKYERKKKLPPPVES